MAKASSKEVDKEEKAKADAIKLFDEKPIPVAKVEKYMKDNLVKSPTPPGLNGVMNYFATYSDAQAGIRLQNTVQAGMAKGQTRFRAVVVPMINASALVSSTGTLSAIPQATGPQAGWVSISLADPKDVHVIVTSELSGCTLFMGVDEKTNTLYMAHIQPNTGTAGMADRFEVPKTLNDRGSFAGVTVTNKYCIGGQQEGKDVGYTKDQSVNVIGFPTKGEVKFVVQKVGPGVKTLASAAADAFRKKQSDDSTKLTVKTLTYKNGKWKV